MLAAARGYGNLESLTALELDITYETSRAHSPSTSSPCRASSSRFHRADGWRRLGFATETQYARERLGISRSALLGRRALADQARIFAARRRSFEATRESGSKPPAARAHRHTERRSSRGSQRAQQRTIKHLREEVNAALTAVRLSGDSDCPPPAEAEIDAFHELERAASSGRIFRQTTGRRTSKSPSSRAAPTESANAAPCRRLASLGELARAGRPDVCGSRAGHGSSVQTSAGSRPTRRPRGAPATSIA